MQEKINKKSTIDVDVQTFIFHIDPVAKGRPKFRNVNGKSYAYTPKKTKEATKDLSERMLLQKRYKIKKEENKRKCGVAVYCKFYCKRPVKFGKGDAVLKTTKPDVDNYVKLLLDACNEAELWDDDSMVVEVLAQKWYCADYNNPRVMLQVNRLWL
jgi:Holliday junction resolvase RusA-like endonuclease